ncbi:MAG: hypothetical protein LUD51_02815 [Clostridia bacterium]|nr:hypothetical protein [Clostridia bacterium]
MESLKKQIETFDRCCEDAKSAQFIVATTKLKEILKCIVSSPRLYDLFRAMVKNFDYAACCRKCLITEHNGLFETSYIALPDDPDETLPFIFCLLAEFDREDYQGFNDFLRKYFNEDGSYASCYENFCVQILDTLRDIIDSMYAESVQKSVMEHQSETVYTSANPTASPAGPGAAAHIAPAQQSRDYRQVPLPNMQSQQQPLPDMQYFQPIPNMQSAQPVPAGAADISSLIADEHIYIAMTDIPDGDKKGAMGILDELDAAIKAGAFTTANALICGYNYFALFHNTISANLPKIIQKLYELEA